MSLIGAVHMISPAIDPPDKYSQKKLMPPLRHRPASNGKESSHAMPISKARERLRRSSRATNILDWKDYVIAHAHAHVFGGPVRCEEWVSSIVIDLLWAGDHGI